MVDDDPAIDEDDDTADEDEPGVDSTTADETEELRVEDDVVGIEELDKEKLSDGGHY